MLDLYLEPIVMTITILIKGSVESWMRSAAPHPVYTSAVPVAYLCTECSRFLMCQFQVDLGGRDRSEGLRSRLKV